MGIGVGAGVVWNVGAPLVIGWSILVDVGELVQLAFVIIVMVEGVLDFDFLMRFGLHKGT